MSKSKKPDPLAELEQIKIQKDMAEMAREVQVESLRNAYGMPAKPEPPTDPFAGMGVATGSDPFSPFPSVWAEDLKKAYMDSLKIRTPTIYHGPGPSKPWPGIPMPTFTSPPSAAEILEKVMADNPVFKAEMEKLATHMVTLEKQVEELKVAKRIAEENAETFLSNLDAERECIRDLRDQLDSARALADEYYKDRELARDVAIEILDALEEERGGEDGQTRRAKAALA